MAKKKSSARKSTKKTTRKTTKKRATKKVVRKKVARGAAKKKGAKAILKRKKSTKKATKKAPKSIRRLPGKAAAVPMKKIAKPKRPRRTMQAAPPAMPLSPQPLPESQPTMAALERMETPAAPAPSPRLVQAGEMAPDFELADETGRMHRLSDYRGRKVVLYFYPKDDTPGCTTEACGFRDRLGEFSDKSAVVFGISPDSIGSHENFSRKYGLNFPLLSDEGHAVADKYGVWVQKEQYGRSYMGIARTTFVIDTDGRIAEVFEKVVPDGHEGEVLASI